ncbi:acyl-CoA dehydrogenase family protein [Streptomyces rhizosphaericus]|uniref:Acyl-CoA/acyl-ACP dehydrogenase n=1 Tax=Streptomyces rhizosphaericus TaxID=114699 RepID=A0A6G4A7L9_9ACTN|nr:acyl-CoA dehydrogenase family protein [Streptomyces rhizosphaericus]NEW69262.1 acyl-CoA/acyl-ACP dehydrogenase [Streptomyces rhizosphaericus]
MTGDGELRSLLDQVARDRWHTADPPAGSYGGDRSSARLWNELESLGLTLVGVSEAVGGSGGTVSHAAEVAKAVGAHTLPLPIAETVLVASWLLEAGELHIPTGPLTVAGAGPRDALRVAVDGSRLVLGGTAEWVPWAAESARIVTVVQVDGRLLVALVDPAHVKIIGSFNIAGEPRQRVHYDTVIDAAQHRTLPEALTLEVVQRRAALARSAQLLGALERTRDLTLDFVQRREQFGRPIIRFPTVAQAVATMAADVALARVAVAAAVDATERQSASGEIECAAAKVMTSRAARLVSAAAHQLHGAIGVTAEYPLHQLTRRLWAWQDEDGTEDEWSARLGTAIGHQDAWAVLSTVGPR